MFVCGSRFFFFFFFVAIVTGGLVLRNRCVEFRIVGQFSLYPLNEGHFYEVLSRNQRCVCNEMTSATVNKPVMLDFLSHMRPVRDPNELKGQKIPPPEGIVRKSVKFSSTV